MNVEQWREIVSGERRGIPTDIILAVIERESHGELGQAAKRKTKEPYTPQEIKCGLDRDLIQRALGLMQITPICLREYNRKNRSDPVTPCELASKDTRAARAQIRVGAWFLDLCLRWAHSVDQAAHPWPRGLLSRPQIELAALAYKQGIGGTAARLRAAGVAGLPLTVRSIQKLDPAWGNGERPYEYAASVASAYDRGVLDPVPAPEPKKNDGDFLLIALLGLVAIYWASKKDPFLDRV